MDNLRIRKKHKKVKKNLHPPKKPPKLHMWKAALQLLETKTLPNVRDMGQAHFLMPAA